MTLFVPGGPSRYAHQRRGLQKMIDTGGVTALLFDPGLGKTATVLDYASLLALKSPTGEARVLVVCPLAAVDTWVQQAETFASPQVSVWAEALGGSLVQRGDTLAARRGHGPEPASFGHQRSFVKYLKDVDPDAAPAVTDGPQALTAPRLILMVANIDTFSSRRTHGSRTIADHLLKSVARYAPDLIVVDESHKIKSAQGNASRLLARIARNVPRRVILTGTVMPHSPMDVFGQWRFLDPYAFGRTNGDGSLRLATFSDFRNRYAVMGGYMGYQITGYRNLDDMRSVMAKNSCVARKADALDLPPTTDVEVPVELGPEEKRAYMQMKKDLAAQLLNTQVVVPNRLTQMMRLRQITSGYLPDPGNGVNHILGASKVRTIESIVHDNLAGEKRIVVFALFTQEIEMLRKRLSRSGTEVMVIQGGTPTADRMAMRKRFGSDDPARIVLVAQVKTLSLAVNELVTANHCIFASLSQQRDDLIQARDRLNRIGQTRPVTFWYALAPGTVDTVIKKSHDDRTDLENAMLQHLAEDTTEKEKENT